MTEVADKLNVLGDAIQPCSTDPLTGFFRDGCCNTGPQDRGKHVVCARVTQRFLEFSYAKGNDLITPRPEFGFAGLQAGDQWCLCLERWIEAYRADAAPDVVLLSTHISALERIPLDVLREFAVDDDGIRAS